MTKSINKYFYMLVARPRWTIYLLFILILPAICIAQKDSCLEKTLKIDHVTFAHKHYFDTINLNKYKYLKQVNYIIKDSIDECSSSIDIFFKKAIGQVKTFNLSSKVFFDIYTEQPRIVVHPCYYGKYENDKEKNERYPAAFFHLIVKQKKKERHIEFRIFVE